MAMRPQSLRKCIYCGKDFYPLRGKGDHIIPARLGEFRNDVRFQVICTKCNNDIGQSEQQLLQCGPERIFREIVVPKTSRSRGKKASWQGAKGMPPPEFRAITDEGVLRARPMENPRDVNAPDQFVLYYGKRESHHIDLFPGISSDALKEKVKKLKLKEIKEARLHCDEAHYDNYIQIIRDGWPESKEERLPSTEPGTFHVPVEIRFNVTDHYFRAIAKIAFHYYLAHSQRFKGNERCFSEIRTFIINGGKIDNFFKGQILFRDIISGMLPSWWVHLLAASEENGVAIGYICLFRGPESEGIEHQVVLGKLPTSPIIVPRSVWAHSYEYDCWIRHEETRP